MNKNIIKKYKNDIILCAILLIIIVLSIIILNTVNNKSESLTAEIWLQGTLIEKIDLSNLDENLKTSSYKFDYYGKEKVIKVEYKHNAIRVVSSDCPGQICVDTGFSSSPNKPIVCMEYGFKIILKSNENEFDVVVGK